MKIYGDKDAYIELLIEQFKQAKGIKNTDISLCLYYNEFTEWLSKRQVMTSDYASFIDCAGIHPSVDEGCIETSKGQYDTITDYYDGIAMITPYFYDEMHTRGRKIVRGEFVVIDSSPMVKIRCDLEPIDTTNVRRIITQNPYSNAEIAHWEQLHNSGEENITVGVYGDISDKDKNTKLKLLKDIRDKINDECIIDYTTDGDSYLAMVSSNRKIKTYQKTR